VKKRLKRNSIYAVVLWVGLEFDQRSDIVMVHSDCSCQISVIKARLLASNEKGVTIRLVRWESPRKFPACCRFPCRLTVGTDGHHAYPDVGRTVLMGVLEGYLNSAAILMSLL
jgi:hypothetical protein